MSARRAGKMSLGDQLDQLRAQIGAAGMRLRELHADRERADREREALRVLVVEAYANDAPDEAAKLQEQAEQVIGPSDEQIAGAQKAVERAKAEADAFNVANYSGLVAERAPGARRLAERLEAAVAEILAAREAWHAEANEQAALLRPVPGSNGRVIAQINSVDELARQARRIGTVEPPLPANAGHVVMSAA